MSLIEAFTNPLAYLNQGADAAGQLVRGTTSQVGNEIDEFVTGALRNNLLGLPLDLAALNIARGRDTGVAPLNLVRNQIFTELNTGHPGHDAEALCELGRVRPVPQAPGVADQLRRRLRHPRQHHRRDDARSKARGGARSGHAWPSIGSGDASARTPTTSCTAWAPTPTTSRDAPNSDPYAARQCRTWSTGSITGLDNVDLWIGGLAEKQNLFGGLLGSTFNFIFEKQMEALQDADRLYYLPRIEGMHFGSEIENNTFAEMIMHNTGTHHLECQHLPDAGIRGRGRHSQPLTRRPGCTTPSTGALLVERLTDEYVDALFNDGQHHAFDTQVHFLGDDNFFGNTMVLGGTEGNDVLIAGQADDDTVWGDGGNDWIDGGNGNDFLFGGAGNDIIRDSAGDDVIHGDAGNDNIDGGLGDDIIFGGDGNDLMHGGNAHPRRRDPGRRSATTSSSATRATMS